MDYEAMKEQWSEIEERDGVRLSWNTFPSSRMVRFSSQTFACGPPLILIYRRHLAWSSPSALYTPP